MNVVSKDVVKLLNLKVKPHPYTFRVAWVNDHTLSVAQMCIFFIQMGDYKDEIYCDVLPMDVAHVLLGHPCLYDLNVANFGKDNIYSFKYKGKNIILRPVKPKGCNGKRDISKLPERNLNILKCKKFEIEGIETGMFLALVEKEVPSDSSIVDDPLEVKNLLNDFVDMVLDGCGKSHFQIVNGYSPRTPIDLVALPPHMRVSELIENFAKHIHDLHAKIRQKISLSNEEYKLATNIHRRYKEFNVGEYVMVHIRPKRIPKTFSKKLYARAMGPYSIICTLGSNAYLLYLPNDIDIDLVFNVKDLLLY